MQRLLLACVLALILAACQRQEEPRAVQSSEPAVGKREPAQAASPISAIPLLGRKMTPHLVESPANAIPLWRQYRNNAPTLVLLSNNPFLMPLPEDLKSIGLQVVQKGTAEEIAQKGTSLTADPAFFPDMSVRLALESGIIDRLVWIFPSEEPEKLKLEVFSQQLLDAGLVSGAESDTLDLKEGQIVGTIAGLPFLAAHAGSLPALAGPILLHIDLSYFQSLYKGEIKTPLYPLLGSTLTALKEKSWPTLAVSISASNLEGGIPLASRFVQRDLGTMFEHPEYLAAALPKAWEYRAQALYLENFFQKEKLRETYLAMEKNAPDDPSVKFALFGVAREFNEGDRALEYLRKAVELDGIYAMEYLRLADLAREKELPNQAVRMLGLARSTFAENPFLTLNMTQAYLLAGQKKEAEGLLRTLNDMPWSEVYYPELPGHLEELSRQAE